MKIIKYLFIALLICLSASTVNAQSKSLKYTVKGVSFSMKEVKGGIFTMGCTSEQGTDCNGNESPAHSVTLFDYYMCETEVTQELWQAVMGKSLMQVISENKWKTYGLCDNCAMYYVSWDDIVGIDSSAAGYTINGITYYQDGFCYKLSQLVGTGKQFRLPTEAEWEYAARGGSAADSQTKYSGSNNVDDVAWYWDNIPSQIKNTRGYGAQKVKTKRANALGIYDMSGNVWEWCSDWFGSYSSSNQTNPVGPSRGSHRVLRGGSWFRNLSNCRVSHRSNYYYDYRLGIFGCRLVVNSN